MLVSKKIASIVPSMARPRFEELIQKAMDEAKEAAMLISPEDINRVFKLQGRYSAFSDALKMFRKSAQADVMEDDQT